MATPPAPSALLSQDALVLQQITGFMSNDFDILDGAGERVVGHVTTTGGGLARLIAGSRSLDIFDADGTPLLHVEDPIGIGFDRSEEHTSELQSRGHLVCRLLLEKKKILS